MGKGEGEEGVNGSMDGRQVVNREIAARHQQIRRSGSR